MVAKTPTKEKRMAAALNPNLVRETLKKVDRCMARLQELQYTVSGGAKVVSGVSLSPRSTRGYLRTSLRCKQESLRMKNAPSRKSPAAKTQGNPNGEWRRMSLPAMLLGETVVEILQASQFAKDVAVPVPPAAKLPNAKAKSDPKTPDTDQRNKKKPRCEGIELRVRRAREKQRLQRAIQSESGSPALSRARSRITFKPKSPPSRRGESRALNGRPVVAAQRVSPKNRPWGKKTVLFPNPAFIPASSSASSSHQQRFYKTRSPIIGRTKQTQPQSPPHKFLVKSPTTSLKSQLKKAVVVVETDLFTPGAKKAAASKVRRCSFSPSKLASRLVSPLKSRISFQKISPLNSRICLQNRGSQLMSGLKQRPNFSTPVSISSSWMRI